MILQKTIPFSIEPRPLPGIQPLDMSDWLIVDDAYGGQMGERRRLLTEQRTAVLGMDAAALEPARELLDMVLAQVQARPDFVLTQSHVICPDGASVAINHDDPLATLGALVQEDFCILDKIGDEHVLTGAVLCFPASWMLSEKFMRPLIGIHEPVSEYDENIARRVQRLFDGVRPGRPLWRFNVLRYTDPTLHQPRSIHERRPRDDKTKGRYLRSEKQSILRLPQTMSVVFSIHTFVVDTQG